MLGVFRHQEGMPFQAEAQGPGIFDSCWTVFALSRSHKSTSALGTICCTDNPGVGASANQFGKNPWSIQYRVTLLHPFQLIPAALGISTAQLLLVVNRICFSCSPSLAQLLRIAQEMSIYRPSGKAELDEFLSCSLGLLWKHKGGRTPHTQRLANVIVEPPWLWPCARSIADRAESGPMTGLLVHRWTPVRPAS
jgi:hypothetical protein